jgi:TatD family-associated radical SAM protein
MNDYVYEYEGNLYLNITNRCSNCCAFCIRNGREGLEGHTLWIDKEPSFEDIKAALEGFDLGKYGEVVFCGFGEPVYNLETLIKTGEYLKRMGKKVRLNTNGQGNLIHKRNIVPELARAIDTVSISLNASSAAKYQEICLSEFGEEGYYGMIEFAKECLKYIDRVILTKVDEGDAEENAACESISKRMGAEFRLRKKV